MLTLLLAAGWACESPITTVELDQRLQAAETAFGDLDLEGFFDATVGLEADVRCLRDSVPRAMTAELHRVLGLREFAQQDEERAKLAFAAARHIQPAYVLPMTLVPDGNPLRYAFEAIPLTVLETARVEKPDRGGDLRFDGSSSDQRPLVWPTLTQSFDADGAISGSAYLWPEDPFPWSPEQVDHGGRRLLWAGVGAGLVSGVLYGASRATYGRYVDSATTDPDELDALRSRTNGFTVGAGVTAVGAVALSTTAVLTGSF